MVDRRTGKKKKTVRPDVKETITLDQSPPVVGPKRPITPPKK